MPESRSTEPLVWIDCEMTGLDLSKDSIMSLACFVTDHNLQMLDHTGYEAVIHHTQDQMDAMGDWCKQHHGASGLTKACLESSTTAETAATELLEYIQKYVPDRRKALLAGNTVHADKAFLVQEPWTKVVKYLHHRIFDVSAIKEAARRWAPVEVLKKSPQKAGKHEAKADILESIEEAKLGNGIQSDQGHAMNGFGFYFDDSGPKIRVGPLNTRANGRGENAEIREESTITPAI
ncbi:Phosphatidylinositol 3,4,5-trisphosphate-dependent Rac exchanger 2 protein [Friedmanniomyces endolithicus]|nr:Phosphatidylinositol 3,4,5-trisphosphate-dependent Rac exchanger 2 protein [Friedmanniomyces endolithicus]KAK1823803.1 Phosphatidylinositol 3,4,5-trisphosphate-dependent Rac exchanger 2 protein [Friedmanniomyces endolithicus]